MSAATGCPTGRCTRRAARGARPSRSGDLMRLAGERPAVDRRTFNDGDEDRHRGGGCHHRPACGVGPDCCSVDLRSGSDQRHDRFLGPETGVPALCPRSYDRAKPTPLVISMHGGAMWPAAQMGIGQWNRIADEHGAIVSSVQEAAVRALETRHLRRLSRRDQQAFVRALMHPNAPSQRLRAAWSRHASSDQGPSARGGRAKARRAR
jgi:Protein of unknown function (DUF1778)